MTGKDICLIRSFPTGFVFIFIFLSWTYVGNLEGAREKQFKSQVKNCSCLAATVQQALL